MFLCMSRNEQIAKLVADWTKQVGKRQALVRLISRGVPTSTAEKLATGRYDSEPRDLLADVLENEMAKDGVTLGRGESSGEGPGAA